MELGLDAGKSWKVMENKPHSCRIFWPMCMFSAFTYIIIVHSQTRFDLLFSWFSTRVLRKSDLFDIPSIKQSWKDMESGHKWSWKVVENHFQCSVLTLVCWKLKLKVCPVLIIDVIMMDIFTPLVLVILFSQLHTFEPSFSRHEGHLCAAVTHEQGPRFKFCSTICEILQNSAALFSRNTRCRTFCSQ